jgi:chitinase
VIQAVPPTVTLLVPAPEAAMPRGEAITVSAQASDRNGKVKEVQFWVREADFFLSKASLVSTATSAPYKGLIKELKPGHYMVWAVAVNDRGASSQSMPVHVMVR